MLKNKISSTRETFIRLGVVSCCDMHTGTTHAVVSISSIRHKFYNVKVRPKLSFS